MKLSPFYNRSRDLAITVTEGERVVFSDPLSRTLFSGDAPPALPYNCKEGRLFEGAKPYLLLRREIRLSSRDFALYAALPLQASEVKCPERQTELVERVMADLRSRFLFLFPTVGEAPTLSSLSVRSYFARVTEEICRSLYAPLDVQIDGCVGDESVLVRRKTLSQAIGLALAALLCEGQSGVCARLSSSLDTSTLSLVGERTPTSEFVRALLSELGQWGGFSVLFEGQGVHFLLPHAHTPAAVLRSTDLAQEEDLLTGYTLLL